MQSTNFVPRTDLFVPNTFTIISAGSFGPNISFWIDDDISAGASGANGGLGDGYLKYNDLGRFLHLPTNSLNARFGQFELDLPFTNARTPYVSGYDIFGEPALGQNPCVPPTPTGVCQTTNNPFVLGTPQRGIEIGGYPNNGNFIWSVAVTDGTNSAYGLANTLSARNTKDVYVRVSQQFNLEKDPESRRGIQAAGPTGPHDHTSIRVGAFYYHGANEYNYGNSVFTNLNLGTINEPFYRVGGDIHFRYRSKFELYGVGLVGHDNNHLVDTGAGTITNAKAVTFTGGFVTANYWIFPWLISTMRYDFVNSPSDFFNGTPASQYLSPTKRWSRLPMGRWHLRVPRSGAGNEGPFSSKTYWWSCIPDCAGASVFQLATRCRAIAKSRCQPQRGRLGDSCWNSLAGKAKPEPIFQEN